MDVKAVERALTPRTKAIMPVHLYGHPADMDPLLQIAKEGNYSWSRTPPRRTARLTRAGCAARWATWAVSVFIPEKISAPSATAARWSPATRQLAEKVSLLRNYCQKVKYVHTMKGFNSRLDTMQAAILRVKLKHLRNWNDQRRAAAARYGQLLAGTEARVAQSRAMGQSNLASLRGSNARSGRAAKGAGGSRHFARHSLSSSRSPAGGLSRSRIQARQFPGCRSDGAAPFVAADLP